MVPHCIVQQLTVFLVHHQVVPPRNEAHAVQVVCRRARRRSQGSATSPHDGGGKKFWRRTNDQYILMVMFCLPAGVFEPLVDSVPLHSWQASSIVPRHAAIQLPLTALFLERVQNSLSQWIEAPADLELCGAASEAACICEIQEQGKKSRESCRFFSVMASSAIPVCGGSSQTPGTQ